MDLKDLTHVLAAEVENKQISVVSGALATSPPAVPSALHLTLITLEEETHRREGSQVIQGLGESKLHVLQTSEFHGQRNLIRIQESGVKKSKVCDVTLMLLLTQN